MRKLNRILIVYNAKKSGTEALVQEMKQYLSDKTVDCLEVSQLEASNSKLCVDLAFSIGGDGTVLTCCRALSDCQNTPIIAVNLGTFGYITEVEALRWKEVFQRYQAGELGLSERKLLSAEVLEEGSSSFENFSDALNDIVISSNGMSKVLKLDMFVNGCYGGAIRSDGVIVASPTGSTAYSLAAGGPILEPAMDAMIINPICPFSLSNRPIVVGGDCEICFSIPTGQRTGICLNADGQVVRDLKEGDKVRITSHKKISLVNPKQLSFIEIIRDKLHWDGGMNA